MAGEAAVLNTLSVRQLRALAAGLGIDVTRARGKADLVKRLVRSESVRSRLAAHEYRVRPVLAEKSERGLRALAAEFGIPIKGARTKADLVDRIAPHPAAKRLLEPSLPRKPELADSATDPLLLKGRHVDVDFGLAEDILDQARMRFEERAFDRVLELAHEALLIGRGTLDAFERAAWAYAILACQRLIEESGRVGRNVQPAASLLRDAKVAYASGNLAANLDLVVKLRAATKALYSEEVKRLRNAVYAAEENISQVAHVGGNVAAAEEALARARDAMERGGHGKALELLAEAELRASAAFDRRVADIRAAIPATAGLIHEAHGLGVDVTEAAKLLEQAKVALDRREPVLAAELAGRAERSILEAQQRQMKKVVDLRLRQVERARAILDRLLPTVAEAASYGISIEGARRFLEDARRVLEQGDYANGTILAKQASAAVEKIVPRLVRERSHRGVATPRPGRCTVCSSAEVTFGDDGWAVCRSCGAGWRWPSPVPVMKQTAVRA